MDTPFIRPATVQDIEALIRLYTEFHAFHIRGVPDRLRLSDTSGNSGDGDLPRLACRLGTPDYRPIRGGAPDRSDLRLIAPTFPG